MWIHVVAYLSKTTKDKVLGVALGRLIYPMMRVVELLWSKGYCYFLDYLEIAYYPSTNRLASGNRFPDVMNSSILYLMQGQ